METTRLNSLLVAIERMDYFPRVNIHRTVNGQHPVEYFVAIWLRDCNGQAYTTFVRTDNNFACDCRALGIGSLVTIGCHVKEIRDDEEYGHRVVVSHVKTGGYKEEDNASKREAKKQQRMAKLWGHK